MTIITTLYIMQVIQLVILAYLSYTYLEDAKYFSKAMLEMQNIIRELSERVDELEWWNGNPDSLTNGTLPEIKED